MSCAVLYFGDYKVLMEMSDSLPSQYHYISVWKLSLVPFYLWHLHSYCKFLWLQFHDVNLFFPRCSIGLKSGEFEGHLNTMNFMSCSRIEFELIWPCVMAQKKQPSKVGFTITNSMNLGYKAGLIHGFMWRFFPPVFFLVSPCKL